MRFPEQRLRDADPARVLAAQPDDRAERDLAMLVAEPAPARAPSSPPVEARRAPILVTALVAAVVVAVTAVLLTVVRPRMEIAATPTPTTCATAGTDALLCGAYRSVRGTGSLAMLGAQPYRLWFTREAGLTVVLSGDCAELHWAVRVSSDRFELGNGGGTPRRCAPETGIRHGEVVKVFTAASDIRYELRGDVLVLHFSPGGATATFVRSASATATPTP